MFGTVENASKNIASVICLILIIGASIFSWNIYQSGSDNSFIEIVCVVTLSLGSIFGKKDLVKEILSKYGEISIFDNCCQIHVNCCSPQSPLADKIRCFKLFQLSFIISNH